MATAAGRVQSCGGGAAGAAAGGALAAGAALEGGGDFGADLLTDVLLSVGKRRVGASSARGSGRKPVLVAGLPAVAPGARDSVDGSAQQHVGHEREQRRDDDELERED